MSQKYTCFSVPKIYFVGKSHSKRTNNGEEKNWRKEGNTTTKVIFLGFVSLKTPHDV